MTGPRLSIERQMINAYRAGQDAAQNAPHRPNPYNGTSKDRAERVLSIMWRRGYGSRNPMVLRDDEEPSDEEIDAAPRHLSIVKDEPTTC